MVSIKDVARLAGVSVGTVSNVLNRPEVVSEDRRAVVEDAIEKLGYVRNDAARQLKAGKSRTVGLILLDVTNPFFASLAEGVQEAGEGQGLAVMLGSSAHGKDREDRFLSLFEEQRVRGILVTPHSQDLSRLEAVQQHGLPVVLVDHPSPDHVFCSVAVDDRAGGRAAVEHLLAQGRRSIAVVAAQFGTRQVEERVAGAREAVAGTAGASLEVVAADDLSILAGRDAGDRIASRPRGERPDAIFCVNDLLAAGIVQAFAFSHRVAIPEEIALIGYDDIPFSRSAVVPVSSMAQPAELMGRTAIELLAADVDQAEGHVHRTVTFQPELVVRESTAG